MRPRCEEMGLIRNGNTRLAPRDDEELTEYLWPIVREMVKTAVENGQNLIVEGFIAELTIGNARNGLSVERGIAIDYARRKQ